MTMRNFVTDPRLHKALDEVESWVGYAISAVPTPLHYRERACCSMHQNQETGRFELWFIPEEHYEQSVYCHEMAHLILWINGAVTKYHFTGQPPMVFFTPPIRHFSQIIWEYMQHVPVFSLVKELKYDEIPFYSPVVASFIELIRQNQFYPSMGVPSFDPVKDQMRCQAGALTQCLALPMAEETRYALRNIALETMPRSLELADAMLSALGRRSLLGKQEYEEYLLEIYHIVELPRVGLRPSFLNKIDLSFRSRILEAAKP